MEQMTNQKMNDGMMMESANTAKKGKGMMFGMIACAVLAVAGIGFGIYEMTQVKSAKQQIADLKIEVKNNDGTTTTVETDKIEVKEADKTVIISDTPVADYSFKASNLITSDNWSIPIYSDNDRSNTYELTYGFTIASEPTGNIHYRYTLDANGKLVAERIPSYSSGKSRTATEIATKFPGAIREIALGSAGNGGVNWLLTVLEDGTVGTLQEPQEEEFGEAVLVEGAKDIVRVYGEMQNVYVLGYAQDKSGKIHQIAPAENGSFGRFKLLD